MANELSFAYGTSGKTLYFLLFNATGQVWNGSAFASPAAGSWSTYAIAATEASTTGIYQANMPSVSAGLYFAAAYLQAGGSAAATDTILSPTSPPIQWDGSSEGGMDLRSILGSKQAANGAKAMGLCVLACTVSGDATATTTSFTSNTTLVPGLSTVPGFYCNPWSNAVFNSGANAVKEYKITGYSFSGGVGTFTVEPMVSPPAPGDGFVILGHG